MGARLVRELQGFPCHQIAHSEDGTLSRQSIACTRTFGCPLTKQSDHPNAAALREKLSITNAKARRGLITPDQTVSLGGLAGRPTDPL
ncbi:hypothetical protein [Hymenobacter siberiensis]|uniref:hypothetical protein n=1 Tax=Hymenobacter siberiensis TaxID=2848396 RepID=UPI001C1E42D9|nr:hypothetical protein [Hymenobacter siberiensis]MBU6122279.1 hypothetical protein [Hymenobacter siberiensis]